MITITPSAETFIHSSLEEANDASLDLALRIVIYPDQSNDCYNYGIGFDAPTEEDLVIDFADFKVLIKNDQREYIEDATLDYVVMEDGTKNLIVMNPNDPSYVPPKKDKKQS